MQRPDPIQKEISFTLEDMFFSTTDSRGIILDGNDIFVNISQYSREELIGKPHNIIRHPDMPKIVFKALWSTIQAGKPICAYVKNLAKNGAYYWVFATVIPIGENYISIRMKPTTPLLGIVENLYKELLKEEKANGVEASLKLLISSLNSLNLADYSAFVLASISQELMSRNELQNQNKTRSSIPKHSSVGISPRDLDKSSKSLFKLFAMINKLSTYSEILSQKAHQIDDTSRNIEFSAFNTNIESEKLGQNGRCLEVVAQHISSNSESVKELNDSIAKLLSKMLGDLGEFKSCQLAIALSTLQVEMLSCFVEQAGNDHSVISSASFKNNCFTLLNLIEQSLNQARPIILALGDGTSKISDDLSIASKILMRLDFIHFTGIIECARLNNGEKFSNLFNEIVKQVEQSKRLFSEFTHSISDIMGDIKSAIADCEVVTHSVDSIRRKIS